MGQTKPLSRMAGMVLLASTAMVGPGISKAGRAVVCRAAQEH